MRFLVQTIHIHKNLHDGFNKFILTKPIVSTSRIIIEHVYYNGDLRHYVASIQHDKILLSRLQPQTQDIQTKIQNSTFIVDNKYVIGGLIQKLQISETPNCRIIFEKVGHALFASVIPLRLINTGETLSIKSNQITCIYEVQAPKSIISEYMQSDNFRNTMLMQDAGRCGLFLSNRGTDYSISNVFRKYFIDKYNHDPLCRDFISMIKIKAWLYELADCTYN